VWWQPNIDKSITTRQEGKWVMGDGLLCYGLPRHKERRKDKGKNLKERNKQTNKKTNKQKRM
jgi:hypothetical protein